MAKQKLKPRKIKARAMCEGFDVTIEATIQPNTSLAPSEVIQVQRELRQKLAVSVASLSFSNIFSHEVRVR